MNNDQRPLTLSRAQAAALLGLKPTGFDVWVRKGIVPGPIAGTRRWSRAAIERAIDGGTSSTEEPDDGLDPMERWGRDHGYVSRADYSRNGQAFIDDAHKEWRENPHIGPLGQREKIVLLAIMKAGDRVLDHGEVPFGPATHWKVAARGYLVTSGPNLYEFRLTPAGRKAAEALINAPVG